MCYPLLFLTHESQDVVVPVWWLWCCYALITKCNGAHVVSVFTWTSGYCEICGVILENPHSNYGIALTVLPLFLRLISVQEEGSRVLYEWDQSVWSLGVCEGSDQSHDKLC